MRQRIINIALGLIILVLLITIFVKTVTADHVAPVIEYSSEELVYEDGMDEAVLLNRVAATDDRDGDVSFTLMIKSLYRTSENYGIVVYAAKDRSNNIATASRGFTYPMSETDLADEKQVDEDTMDEDSPFEDENPDGADSGGGALQEPGQDEEGIQDTSTDEDVRYGEIRAQQLSNGAPFIRLSQTEVTLSIGTSFAVQNYIDEVVDAEDDFYTLSRRLRVSEAPDTSTAGIYEISVYVLDTDGNISNTEILNLRVE